MDPRNISDSLLERIERAATSQEPLDVVVEVEDEPERAAASLSRAERIALLRERFQGVASQVEERVRALGGLVLDTAWVNRTMRVRIAAGRVADLADVPRVDLVDLPRALKPDVGSKGPSRA